MTTHNVRYAGYGLGFILGVVAIVTLSIMQFNRAFTTSVPLSLHSTRAGLLMTTGADVKMRGVTVGHVDGISATAGGAVLDLAITPEQLHLIPSDVRAQIIPPTFFGGKYVELSAPAGDHHDAIAAHATIDATHVTVEINDTFAHLMQLLDATQPAKVNAALNALATTLQGRGNEAGQLLTKIDTYLRQINPALGTLDRDLPPASSVLNTYADVAPNLLRTANNVSTTSDSIQSNRASLDAFLLSLTSVSNKTTSFVQANEKNLGTALDVLQPATRVLAEYAPELPCFFQGLANALPLAESAVGGKQPGLGVLSQFLPPETPYKYSKDLPTIGADIGPRCYGMPNIPNGKQIPHQIFNVGTDPYANDSSTPGFTQQSLLELLFGPLTGEQH
jgi:phospholipid/cholesterol/gamma-HCH transport system substrate-binding protein